MLDFLMKYGYVIAVAMLFVWNLILSNKVNKLATERDDAVEHLNSFKRQFGIND